jgi:hypothetical protein
MTSSRIIFYVSCGVWVLKYNGYFWFWGPVINVWAKTWVLDVLSFVACVSHIDFVQSREICIEGIEVFYNSAIRLIILNAVNYEKERTAAVFYENFGYA